jgi:signal transduction histidine kinase
MRLRHRLLLLFAVFAVVPLLAMGAFDYASSLRHLEAVLAVQTGSIASRAARELQDRLDLQASDLALLSENAETQRLLRIIKGGDSSAIRSARQAAEAYWRDLWRTMRFGYSRITLLDAAGQQQLSLTGEPEPTSPQSGTLPIRVEHIRALESGEVVGRVELSPRIADLFQSPLLRTAFGVSGRTLVLERGSGQTLIEPTAAAPTAGPLPFPMERLSGDSGTFDYRVDRDQRVVSYVNFGNPDWTLVVTASVDEFAAPFIRLRLVDFALLLGVVLAVSIGFFLLLRRATASLDRITLAADRVGRGDFDPALPPGGSDEVGRLSSAFALMTTRIREMIGQVEASRQMGVLGRFAAELSHEIRNPLTAIKINLQGLERDAREGRIPDDSRRAVDLALREIRRLDLAVKVALKTGRPPAEPQPFQFHRLLQDAVELIRPQAAGQGVAITTALSAERDHASGDAEAVRGAVLNLLLNALEAMPGGGRIALTTGNVTVEGRIMLELRVRDSGPGIPAEIRDRVFRPFFTTRDQGTGLGLSMALQTFRALGGGVTLGDASDGAEIVVTIPVQEAA